MDSEATPTAGTLYDSSTITSRTFLEKDAPVLSVSIDKTTGKITGVSKFNTDSDGNVQSVDAYSLLTKETDFASTLTLAGLRAMDSEATPTAGTLYDSSTITSRTFLEKD